MGRREGVYTTDPPHISASTWHQHQAPAVGVWDTRASASLQSKLLAAGLEVLGLEVLGLGVGGRTAGLEGGFTRHPHPHSLAWLPDKRSSRTTDTQPTGSGTKRNLVLVPGLQLLPAQAQPSSRAVWTCPTRARRLPRLPLGHSCLGGGPFPFP